MEVFELQYVWHMLPINVNTPIPNKIMQIWFDSFVAASKSSKDNACAEKHQIQLNRLKHARILGTYPVNFTKQYCYYWWWAGSNTHECYAQEHG